MKSKDKILDLQFQRKLAKNSLAVSMGICAFSGFKKGKAWRKIHKISGISMLGFAIWYTSLYGTRYSEYLSGRKNFKNSKKGKNFGKIAQNLPKENNEI